MRKIKPTIIRNITKLVDIHENGTWSNVDIEIQPEGDLVLIGQDLGEAPKGFFGSSEYEYWLRIKAENKKRLLAALKEKHEPGIASLTSNGDTTEAEVIDHDLVAMLQKYYTNHTQIVSDLQGLLNEREIPCEFSC